MWPFTRRVAKKAAEKIGLVEQESTWGNRKRLNHDTITRAARVIKKEPNPDGYGFTFICDFPDGSTVVTGNLRGEIGDYFLYFGNGGMGPRGAWCYCDKAT